LEFSLLLSVYYKENPEFLAGCFKSIVAQTLLPNEVVIVKDGPLTEALEGTLAECMKQIKIPIKIIELKSNEGLGISLQEGLNACSYEYVARMDTDDVCHPERFEKQVEVFNSERNVDVVGTLISEFNEVIGDLNVVRKVPSLNHEIYAYAKFRNPMNHMTVMFKKSSVLQAGGYQRFQNMEDYYLWFRMMLKKYIFYNLQESLVYARVGYNMHSRRSGRAYFLTERIFFKMLKSHRFISTPEYLYVMSIRSIIRIIPHSMIKSIYNLLLRS
jgi:glycosyltransferase involved in cell wall biosynthesis